MPVLHIFIDESGNFDFTPKGTRYFILSAVSTVGCGPLYSGFYELKHDLAASGIDVEEFHATEDKQAIRDRVYDLLEQHCAHDCIRIDNVIAQKNKANPSIREASDFYSRLLKSAASVCFPGQGWNFHRAGSGMGGSNPYPQKTRGLRKGGQDLSEQ